MNKSSTAAIHLASGIIDPLGDSIVVELVQSTNMPAVVRITWPDSPTSVVPATFSEVVQEIGKLFGYATAVHNEIRAERDGAA